MSKKILLVICSMALSLALFAQINKEPVDRIHKIVFHLSSDDTLVHKGLMKQLNNVLIAAPGSIIEVICHGPGLTMLLRENTLVLDKIQLFKTKGVAFQACENTLREKNISKEKIINEAGFVPSALIAIVIRQEEGWSYIKAGF
jgi:uncharacterized protein